MQEQKMEKEQLLQFVSSDKASIYIFLFRV